MAMVQYRLLGNQTKLTLLLQTRTKLVKTTRNMLHEFSKTILNLKTKLVLSLRIIREYSPTHMYWYLDES